MEYKVLKQKKLDKELTLKISEDPYADRIYVEFSTDDRKLVLQRSFQNTLNGIEESKEFAKSLKSVNDLKSRLAYRDTKKQ